VKEVFRLGHGAQAHHGDASAGQPHGDTVYGMTMAAFPGPLYGDDARRRDFA
jgi:hypothetical protein